MPPSVEQIRASLTVLLAKAVKDLFPKMELIRGRVTDHGFVYEVFNAHQEIDDHALARLEERMLELLRERVAIKNIQMLRDNAVDYFIHKGESIKASIASRAKGELLNLVQVGELLDLVDAEGVTETSELKYFKLLKCEGAAKNYAEAGTVDVQQIFGTAFLTKYDLKQYLKRLGSTQHLDHQSLGVKGGLFYLDPASPDEGIYWLERGLVVKDSLIKILEAVYHEEGFQFVQVPTVSVDKKNFIAKLFASSALEKKAVTEISYIEREGEDFDSMGLWRSFCYFTDQSYLLVQDQELSQTLISSLQMIAKIVNMFASGYRWVVCCPDGSSVRKLPGSEKVLAALTAALDSCGFEYTFESLSADDPGVRACLCLPDMYGKYWKCSHLGFDLRMSAKESKGVKSSGLAKGVWFVELSLLGSFDRLIAYLIEHHQGCLPFKVAPEQVRVISQRGTSHGYAESVAAQLRLSGVRVGVDLSEGKLGAKIHKAESAYVPVIVVVGDKEAQTQTVALRAKTTDDKMLYMNLESFLQEIKNY
jgi:threonyl-tRNA synthetase